MPSRPDPPKWDSPVSFSVEQDGVTYKGYYQLERDRSGNRRILVTHNERESKPAFLHAMPPETLAKRVLLEIVGKQKSG
jgi:hypothetical protein